MVGGLPSLHTHPQRDGSLRPGQENGPGRATAAQWQREASRPHGRGSCQ